MASFSPAPYADRSRPSLPPAEVDCKWWRQGDCFRGDTCYFRHDPAVKGLASGAKNRNTTTQDKAEPTDASVTAEKCGICLEAPRTFGLLVKCDHVFCFECVKNWRGSANQRDPSSIATYPFTDDTRGLKKTSKTCPICRTHSDFIVPSAVFPSHDLRTLASVERSEAKEHIIAAYLARIRLIPCRYFQKSVEPPKGQDPNITATTTIKPSCRFGNACQYAHAHPVTGEPYVFTPEELDSMRERTRRKRRVGPRDARGEGMSAFEIDLMLLQLAGIELDEDENESWYGDEFQG